MDLRLSSRPTELRGKQEGGPMVTYYGFLSVGGNQVLMAVQAKSNDRSGLCTVVSKNGLTHLHAKYSDISKQVQNRRNSRFPRNDEEIAEIAKDQWEMFIMTSPQVGATKESHAEA